MKKSFLAIMAVTPFIFSCAPVYSQTATAQQRFEQTIAQCPQEAVSRKNVIEKMDCTNNARVKTGIESGINYMPLVYQYGAANKAVAVDYADGKITKNKFDALLQQNQAAYYQAVAQFQSGVQQQQSKAWQNTWQALGNVSQQMQQAQPAPPPLPTTTNCRRTYNGGISCTTW